VSAESHVHKLIIREIIFEEFQRVWSQSTNVTDGQTDNLSWQYRATLSYTTRLPEMLDCRFQWGLRTPDFGEEEAVGVGDGTIRKSVGEFL